MEKFDGDYIGQISRAQEEMQIIEPKRKRAPKVYTTFETTDIGFSALLLCLKFEMIDMQQDDRRKIVMVFRRKSAISIERTQTRYYDRDFEVDALSYNLALRQVKTDIYRATHAQNY